MTSIAMPATGASFGDFDEPTNWKTSDSASTGGWAKTPLRNLENSSIRDALIMFDAALTASSSLRLFAAAPIRRQIVEVVTDHDIALDWLIETDIAGADSVDAAESWEQQPAVAVVEHLVEILGIPKRDVLRAAGISKSTYHSWDKPKGPRPRVASQGQLWALVEAVDELTEYLGAANRVGPWLLADPHRKSLWREGQFDRVVALAAPSIAGGGVAYSAGAFAAGHEKLEPPVSEATSARMRNVDTETTFERVRRGDRRSH